MAKDSSQRYPSKSRSLLPNFFSKLPSTTPTQSISSLPLVPSTADSRGKTALGKHAIISPFVLLSKLNIESSIANTPSGHRTLPPLPEARTPASFSAVQDQPKSSAQQATLTTTPIDQSYGLASKPPENRQTAPKPGSSTKDILKLTGRSILTLTKRLPEIVDGNPVKMALGLVKLIIEIQQVRHGSSHCSPPDYRPRLWQAIWIPLNEG
ncbi:hypothetical protein K443DRAFT_333921 [Laccaria amethystina LaAM-08-1]|uniref:Unplaced genomic scaffold K443scaffold_23, whole genome shotgun sequence n=1 Tax=Laccaria amethystina LaAM-08-1 TaxID=1095629 RepID=A0A0C9XKS0_9AGAR|nr:hypothetical protein K443DRAFT_333921 [Laccaria amethystina LaAM-08-1]